MASNERPSIAPQHKERKKERKKEREIEEENKDTTLLDFVRLCWMSNKKPEIYLSEFKKGILQTTLHNF